MCNTNQNIIDKTSKNAKFNISLLLEFGRCFSKRMNIESRNLTFGMQPVRAGQRTRRQLPHV